MKVGSDYVWLWVAIEPTDRTILGICIFIERKMLVAEQFIKSLIRKYGKHSISTDGGIWCPQGIAKLRKRRQLTCRQWIDKTRQRGMDRPEEKKNNL